MRYFLIALLFALPFVSMAQTISQKLATAFERFEQDSQLQSALASLYVVDDKGNVVFQKNGAIGLAPASTQKVITSVTAYELLGKSFQYKTDFSFVLNHDGTNSLYIKGNGDPTLGSWRWNATDEDAVLNRIITAAKNAAITNVVLIDTTGWEGEAIPGGWIWEDIGNYYGAGSSVVNWRENQYDVYLRSGTKVGDPAVLAGTQPVFSSAKLVSKVTSGPKGSGDNAYIYFSVSGDSTVVRGTVPVGESRFKISGALPNPVQQFATTLLQKLTVQKSNHQTEIIYTTAIRGLKPFHTETSPPLDSIIYWLNKKSINLYGEALLKTIAYQESGHGNTDSGMGILKSFWKNKGIPATALNMVDGSGLSPLNRITTQAQVSVLQYAKKQPWFPGFYASLPEYNGMKLKSGTINGVKGFAGYHTSRAGISYTISFLVNNYNGSSSELVKKMYAVLDVLK